MNDRYQPDNFEEATRNSCKYCHKTPPVWQQVGNEKICAHCGTRVYNSAMHIDKARTKKSA